MRGLIEMIAASISQANNYTREEHEQVEYAMRIAVFEAMKTAGIVLLFVLLGYAPYSIVAVTAMSISKPFIGGFHEDNQVKCFIATAVTIGSIIYLSASLEIGILPKLILNAIALFSIWQQAPVVNPKMPITRKELLIRNRNIGVTVIGICVILSILFYSCSVISNTLMWSVVLQAILMFNKRTVI